MSINLSQTEKFCNHACSLYFLFSGFSFVSRGSKVMLFCVRHTHHTQVILIEHLEYMLKLVNYSNIYDVNNQEPTTAYAYSNT